MQNYKEEMEDKTTNQKSGRWAFFDFSSEKHNKIENFSSKIIPSEEIMHHFSSEPTSNEEIPFTFPQKLRKRHKIGRWTP